MVEEIIVGKETFTPINQQATKMEQTETDLATQPNTKMLPAARYWIIPNNGIVKYEYFPTADQPIIYELISYRL